MPEEYLDATEKASIQESWMVGMATEAEHMSWEALTGWLVAHIRQVDEIGRRQPGSMADRASLEHAETARKLATLLAHYAHQAWPIVEALLKAR